MAWFARCIIIFALAYIGGPAVAASNRCRPASLAPVNGLGAILKDHAEWLQTRDHASPSGHKADLRFKDLTAADLKNADLREADLSGSKLETAHLDGAKLALADLSCVNALKAQLAGANLFQAKLIGAALTAANLAKAELAGADLSGAELIDADLTGASLVRAKLIGTRLTDTLLADSNVDRADVTDAIWQPRDVPKSGIGTLRNLQTVRLDETRPNPTGIGALLKALRDAGASTQARDLTSAKERSEAEELWREGGLWPASRSIGWFTYGFLTEYDRSPQYAFLWALLLVAVFAPIYFKWGFPQRASRNQIFKIELEGTIVASGRGYKTLDAARLQQVRPANLRERLKYSLLLSLWSAIRIGVGPINVIEGLRRAGLADRDLAVRGPIKWVAGAHTGLTVALLVTGLWSIIGRVAE